MRQRSAPFVLAALAAILAGCASRSTDADGVRAAPSTVSGTSEPTGLTSESARPPRIPGAEASSQTASGSGAERDVETVRLHVDGMTCPTKCVREVKEMLSSVPGLVNVAVDSPTQTVLCNVTRGTDPQALVDAIRSPYRARLL